MNRNGDEFPKEAEVLIGVKHVSKPGRPFFGAADMRHVAIRVLPTPGGLYMHHKATIRKAPCPLKHCPQCGVPCDRGHPNNGCELAAVVDVCES